MGAGVRENTVETVGYKECENWGRDTAEPEGVWGREGGERAEMLVWTLRGTHDTEAAKRLACALKC